MNTTTRQSTQVQQVLMQLFEQVKREPSMVPEALVEQYPEGSQERELLEGFISMLARLREEVSTPNSPHDDAARLAEEQLNTKVNGSLRENDEHYREIEQQYEAVFEATSDGLVINDMDGIVVAVNSAFCEMHGYSREEFIGSDLTRLHPPGSQPVYWEYLDTVRDGRVFATQVDHIHQRKDGTQFYVEVRGTVFTFNGQSHMLGVVRDVTERVQAYELLEQRVQERTRELSTLHEQAQETARITGALSQTASRVAFGGSLESTLGDICQHVVLATSAVASAVVLFGPQSEGSGSDERAGTRFAGAYGLPQDYIDTLNKVLAAGAEIVSIQALMRRQTSIVAAQTNPRMADLVEKYPDFETAQRYILEGLFETFVSVPLIYGDNLVGGLIVYYPRGVGIDDNLLAFQVAIADQTAVAVENTRLLQEVQEKAALEQRQHLARELHDSVSQALFSINLTAGTMESLLKREAPQMDAAVTKLGDLRQLTKGALAEMRALIFELRPRALEEEGLVRALRHHAAAVAGREMLQVEVVCRDEGEFPRLKPTAEEAFYRIAQEALHNVVKHARATRVEVCLDIDTSAEAQVVRLRIADDGKGFDQSQVPAGHLGLGTMGQRAAGLGGAYSVESRPGEGTTVTVQVPLAVWRLPERKAAN